MLERPSILSATDLNAAGEACRLVRAFRIWVKTFTRANRIRSIYFWQLHISALALAVQKSQLPPSVIESRPGLSAWIEDSRNVAGLAAQKRRSLFL